MIKSIFISAFIAVGLQYFTSGAIAQPVANEDADFVQKAGEGGMLEVNLGQLALKKAESQK